MDSDSTPHKLKAFDPLVAPRTRDRIEAVRQYVSLVGNTHSILGWVEGPLAEYVDLRGLDNAMVDLIEEPSRFHEAAQVIVDCAIAFARPQIEAGADVIGVGDAAASLIGPDLYRRHVLPWQQKLLAAIHNLGETRAPAPLPGGKGVKIKLHICGNIAAIAPHLAESGADIIDVD